MRYDVIVIGAGSAGSVMAARLSEEGDRSVLLLEAGPDYPGLDGLPEDLQWGDNLLASAFGPHTWGYVATGTPQQRDSIPVPRGRVVGGTGAINGQVVLRGTPEDYDEWAAWGSEEWAFTKVLPYFRKLETDLDFGGDLHGSSGPLPVRRCSREQMRPHQQAFYEACLAEGSPEFPDQNHPEATGIALTPTDNRDGLRVSTALAYLDHARHRPNLTIRANGTARRILFEGQRAVGVEAESAGGDVHGRGRRDRAVRGCDRLAAAPDAVRRGPGGTAASAGVVRDLPGVGQNLRDHPYAMILVREKGPEPGLRQPPAQPILRYTAERSTTRNDMQVGTIAMDGAYLPPPITPDDVCFVIFAALHKAVGAGELRVASTDPHVQPAINYNYLADNWDRERMREGIRLGIRLSEHPALKERVLERVSPADADLATDAALDAWVMANVGSGFHSAGTCQMGPASDPMAVVDQFCRVRGLAGLRVVDASVMPDVIRANTNATVAMIAERVADWMREGR